MISKDSFSINSRRSFHLSLEHKRMLLNYDPNKTSEGDHSVLNNVYILGNARNIFYFILSCYYGKCMPCFVFTNNSLCLQNVSL